MILAAAFGWLGALSFLNAYCLNTSEHHTCSAELLAPKVRGGKDVVEILDPVESG